VGVFEYTHLRPANPTGNDTIDYPLCYPGAGYPDETRNDRVIQITAVDPRNLPASLRQPDGIRCGYVPSDRLYTVPGLGSPNAPESSSVYVLDVSKPQSPEPREIVKTGPLVGTHENGIDVYSGSHPNAVVVGAQAIYVANGNNDSISILDPRSYEERGRIGLSLLHGQDRVLKGVQPVGLALSPDGEYLYVAEAGVNAVGVIRLNGMHGQIIGHIPTGWWPSSVQVSDDGKELYVANAREHHPDAHGTAVGCIHGARVCEQWFCRQRTRRLRRRRSLGRWGLQQSDPKPGWEAEFSDQARHLHQQGECHPRPAPRRHHTDAQRSARERRAHVCS
jgi:hypothetical protein